MVEHTSLCFGTARITDHQPVLKPKVSVMGVECIGIPKANNFPHAKTIVGICQLPPEPVNVLRNALSSLVSPLWWNHNVNHHLGII